MTAISNPKNIRRFQLAVGLVLAVALAAPLLFAVRAYQETQFQRQHVQPIVERLGGRVTWRGDGIGPRWPSGGQISRVDLSGTAVTDGQLAFLQRLSGLRRLCLQDTQVTDAGLVHLECLNTLESISLRDTGISDAGVARLSNLRKIQHLDLSDTRITDAAIPYLASMKHLEQLILSDTDITDEGLMQFSRLHRTAVDIDIEGTQVTKAGWDRYTRQSPGYDSRDNAR